MYSVELVSPLPSFNRYFLLYYSILWFSFVSLNRWSVICLQFNIKVHCFDLTLGNFDDSSDQLRCTEDGN